MPDVALLNVTGVPELERAFAELSGPAEQRLVVRQPARKAMQPIRTELKARSRRTHPLSMQRDPTGGVLSRAGRAPRKPNQKIGPMARFVTVRALSKRSKFFGARVHYDTRKFPGFVVYGKSTGKRAFYPAAQEYGAKANPPIKKKGQMAGAAKAQQSAAVAIFRREFRTSYENRAKKIFRRSGIRI